MNEASMEIVSSSEYSITKKRILYIVIKRTFDLIMSLLSLVLLCPLFIVIMVLIRLDSKGKAIYKHKRIGKDGKYIYLYKFRTMYIDADKRLEELLKDPNVKKEWEENYKLGNDPRITKIGKVLRSTSLDELPQLINILFNDMSFVGPRPLVDGEIDKYGINKNKLLSVLPGLTGWWACNGRSCTSYQERMKLELYYVENRSILLDIKTILKTFVTVFKRTGAK